MKIGIIGAMETEVARLKEMMSSPTVTEVAGMRFFEGILCEKSVIIVQSGMGKVNAAACAQVLISNFRVTHIINTGVAGCLNPAIEIGDIVLGVDTLEHDYNLKIMGFKRGQIPSMPPAFKADETLLAVAEKASKKLPEGITVHKGRVVTGDEFICGKEAKEELVQLFQGWCCEMEGAAIAHVAYLNKIPFLVIRAISDKADGTATDDYQAFEKAAIENYITLVTGMLKEL